MPPRYLERPIADAADLDLAVTLPYGMTAAGILAAITDIYAYIHAVNAASIEHRYDRLEDLMLPASFSGLISELVVRAVARENATGVPGVTRNLRPGGRPDIIPRAMYPGDAVLHGPEGVEVKTSKSATSWQGHSPETGWLMVVQIAVDRTTAPVYDRVPTTVERVLLAELVEADWTYSGRREGSRRTPTASINPAGRAKLAAGIVYQRGRSVGATPPPVALH
ncbi:MAG: hypothetical protein M0Z49_15285 [Chloroflexi bacterium]|nr:hypothetical protein [Chloroflexota bacterium]MDA8237093.1 hypothetical protein [Chloroflexota bacterium]